MAERQVFVRGAFDDLRSRQVRLFHEASRLGRLNVILEDDELARKQTGKPVKFPLAERRYVVEAIRYVSSVTVTAADWNAESSADSILVVPSDETRRVSGIENRIIPDSVLTDIPSPAPCPINATSRGRKVVVTGCFDWFHSGHVRFFEEVAALGDLCVIVGHDENIRLLKGKGHPLFTERERCYMVGAIRHVTAAMVSSGHGWLDGEPEIREIQPDIYAVNEDGDHPDKRNFCQANGIEYRVLRRLPREGLPRRQSSILRGF